MLMLQLEYAQAADRIPSSMEGSLQRKRARAGGDRLTNLPDCLLNSVLSFLKARQVVQTCVLSRRWRHVWRAVPCVDVDHGEFQSTEEEDDEIDKLERFTGNLLSRRNPETLQAFRLRAGARRETVRLLSLARCSRSLTRLHLDRVSLYHSFAEQLASGGFPVLRVLELRNSEYCFHRIASSMLESLTIDGCRNSGNSDVVVVAPRLATLRLGIPFYRDRNAVQHEPRYGFTVAGASSLAQASIRLWDANQHRMRDNLLHGKPIIQQSAALLEAVKDLLGCLSSVSTLELSGFHAFAQAMENEEFPLVDNIFFEVALVDNVIIPIPFQFHDDVMQGEGPVSVPVLQAVFDKEQGNPPLFGNLRTLILDECDLGDNLQTLWRVLQHTPTLEKLTLQNCKLSNGSGRMEGMDDKMKIASSLKLVEIKHDEHDTQQLHEVIEEVSRGLPKKTEVQVTVAGGNYRYFPFFNL